MKKGATTNAVSNKAAKRQPAKKAHVRVRAGTTRSSASVRKPAGSKSSTRAVKAATKQPRNTKAVSKPAEALTLPGYKQLEPEATIDLADEAIFSDVAKRELISTGILAVAAIFLGLFSLIGGICLVIGYVYFAVGHIKGDK